MGETIDPSIKEEFLATFAEFERHQLDEPHWHLPFIGVTPRYQRRGYGAALMERVIAECDRSQTPAALESTNPANLSLYIRYGFEIRATVQVGSSPPLFPMVRRPQT